MWSLKRLFSLEFFRPTLATFIGQYLHSDLFGRKRKKTNLIGTLVYRALKICSPEKLSSEVSINKNILQQNGYPEKVIISGIKKENLKFPSIQMIWRRKVSVISTITLDWKHFP